MSISNDEKSPYEALGLPPDATLDQVKSRYRELNDAYLKILQLSKSGVKSGAPAGLAPAKNDAVQDNPQADTNPRQGASPTQHTHTEPMSRIKARLAKGEIQKAQFEKLAKERWTYLKNKPFSELTDSEFEERTKEFEGLKFL